MKNNITFFLSIILFVISFDNASSKTEDKIIAKIGNSIITRYDIINEVNTILAISNKKADEKDLPQLQNLAFESLKKGLIKKNEILKYKISQFNNEDLNNYISRLESSLGLEEGNLENHFKKYGANYNYFKESIINNLKWNTLIYLLYKDQLLIDNEQIKKEINRKIKEEKEIIELNLSEIVIENRDENKLKEIQESITKIGFEQTATLFSSSVTSSKGGSIGWIDSKSISSIYLSEINKLKNNQISKPIKTNKNIAIIKLNNKRIINRENINLARIERNIINKKKQEKLNLFSNSHFLSLERKTYVEVND